MRVNNGMIAMTATAILLTVALLVSAAGCSNPRAERDSPAAQVDTEFKGTLANGLYSVTLKDGTRCVVYSGLNGRSGLSCNWGYAVQLSTAKPGVEP